MKLFARLKSKTHALKYEPELFNERTFYEEFSKSLRSCKFELIIESPFLTSRRVDMLLPELEALTRRGVNVIINTRDPKEHDTYMQLEAENTLDRLHELGLTVLYTGSLHRKVAIIDRKTLWEGSLNILSQNDSCEIMQKVNSVHHVHRVIEFTGLTNFLPEF